MILNGTTLISGRFGTLQAWLRITEDGQFSGAGPRVCRHARLRGYNGDINGSSPTEITTVVSLTTDKDLPKPECSLDTDPQRGNQYTTLPFERQRKV